jgi:hypothetical protein
MPSSFGGDTERCCGKLKNRNSFSKPNFEASAEPPSSLTGALSSVSSESRLDVFS